MLAHKLKQTLMLGTHNQASESVLRAAQDQLELQLTAGKRSLCLLRCRNDVHERLKRFRRNVLWQCECRCVGWLEAVIAGVQALVISNAYIQRCEKLFHGFNGHADYVARPA